MKARGKRRLARALTVLLAASMLLTGCWDRRELNQLAITSATGIDYKNGQWNVDYQVIIPSAISAAMTAVGGGPAKLPVIVYSTQGPTIREAVWKSAMESPRQLFFSHTRVVVIGREAAEQGLTPLIDVYLRNPDSRETVSVLISDGRAREIIEQLMQIQIIPGDGIEETVKGEARNMSVLPNVKMYDLAMQLLGPARSAVIPEILVSGGKGVTSSGDLDHTALSSKLRLGRLAVLRRDKFVGWLSSEEALGVSFLRDGVKMTSFAFSCGPNNPKVDSTFRVMKSKTKMTPRRTADGGLEAEVAVEAEGTLLETNCPMDLNKPESAKEMERQLEQQVAETIESSWQAVKKLKTDVIGLADSVHRKYPKMWKKLAPDWDRKFAEVELRVRADITVKRMGLSGKSFKLQEDKQDQKLQKP